jgi:arginase family enzyme
LDPKKVPLEVVNNRLHGVLVCLGHVDGAHHARSVVAKVLDAVGVRQRARECLEEFNSNFDPAYVSIDVHAIDQEARTF